MCELLHVGLRWSVILVAARFCLCKSKTGIPFEVAQISHRRQLFGSHGFTRLLGHNQMMLGINGRLHLVAYDSSTLASARHRPGVGVGQGDLAIGGGLHLLLQAFDAAHLIVQRRDALLEPNGLAH